MPVPEPTVARITHLLIDRFALTELTAETPLFSSGLLDSFNLAELLNNLESEFGVAIRSGEVSLENLDTPQRMVGFLKRKLGESS